MEKASFLEYCLSFIREQHVTTVKSKINPELTVSYFKGRFLLSTPNAIYSFEDNYKSFRIAFEKLKPGNRDFKKILTLGFGLGSIPIILHKIHGITADFTAVEIDTAIIELARKYSNLPEKLSVQMVCMDAHEFVMKSEEKFDLVAVDLFIDDVTPEKFIKDDFLRGLKKILALNGQLVFSRMYHTAKQKQEAVSFYENIFRKIFPGSRFILAGSNLMLVAG